MTEVAAHELTINVKVPEWVPTHADRTESANFAHNRQQLIDDGHGYCLGCKLAGITETKDLQCHHFAVEWAETESTNWESALWAAKKLDPYGYAAAMGDTPMTDPDDIRNLMMLCQPCHTGKPGEIHPNIAGWLSGGIHYAPLPIWFADRIARGGEEQEANPNATS
jgi:hypothetical protein